MKLLAAFAAAAVLFTTSAASQSVGPRDALSASLMRRELQRARLSVPGREVVHVLTEIPPGVASGWHTHPGEEVGYILAGDVEMMVAGRAPALLHTGDVFFIPARTPHNARDLGPETGQMLSVYIVETGLPLSSFVTIDAEGR